jgi:hypothetical protein
VSEQTTQLPAPGPQAAALDPLFVGKWTWSGMMVPGALGPGSPELPTSGVLSGSPVTDGFWYTYDISSTAGTGDVAFTWRGHFVVGWDAAAAGYRALLTDNIGMWVPLRAELSGTVFTATSELALPLLGQLTKARFSWDFADPVRIVFTNEHQVGDGPWQLWEQETIVPA